ncbi:MAG: transglycosylase family protein [Actinobacteria bacterium]|nr:transglycosylase family protein [Actinomycetota bacterium]
MPGPTDGWSPVKFSTLSLRPHRSRDAQASNADPAAEAGAPAGTGRRRGRRALVVVAGATVVVLAGAGAAVADAHKTVTLDVDGQTRTLSTFAGSVSGLLEAQDVAVGTRDTVSVGGALQDGSTIVVRHAQLITVLRDGVRQAVWTTALTADEALETLDARAGDVWLVVSRSAPGGRFDLPLDLALDGPAEVLVDGTTLEAPDPDVSVGDALAALDVVLGPLDEVTVRHGGDGVQVVVTRVVVQDVTVTSEVAYASSTVDDPARYVGTTKVVTAGVAGVRTQVQRVTTADGVERTRVTLSDEVTSAPVDEVVAVGTKARPVVVAQAAAASAASGGLNWAALAACESGGRVDAVSANGKYHGLYQFSLSTWAGVGGSGLPSQASAEEQTARAQALYDRSGAGQWPHCGPRLFS